MLMQDLLLIDQLDAAIALLKPQRLEILRKLDEPHTCPELAESFGASAQQIYYHVKALENAGLVEKVGERRIRGAVEGRYQAKARSYWLAPKLVGQIGGAVQAADQASLRALMSLAEQVLEDTGKLGQASAVGKDVPSLSMSAQIALPDARKRGEFMRDVQLAFQEIAEKYGIGESAESSVYRLMLACYPSFETTDLGDG